MQAAGTFSDYAADAVASYEDSGGMRPGSLPQRVEEYVLFTGLRDFNGVS